MLTVGIDLGTSNSVVAATNSEGITRTIASRQGDRILPSAVFFDSSGDTVIGSRAKAMAVLEPDRVAMVFKRGMGEQTFLSNGEAFVINGKSWRPEELSALVLKKLKAIAEEEAGEPVTGAIVTVPAYFGELERSATRDAAELAGLELIRIINEPTAAAIAHGLEDDATGKNILVFDLGGGTFDVTVMSVAEHGEMNVRSTGGNRQLGGTDFDAIILSMIADYVKSETGADIFSEDWMFSEAKEKAEDIKIELSTAESATRPIATGQRPCAFTLTRTEFEQALADIIEDVSDMVEMTLDESGLEASDIDTILMVGGSSRIPVFAKRLTEMFGKDPVFSKNLDEDVARGAAILAARVDGNLNPMTALAQLELPNDVASHGLGVTVKDSKTNQDYNAVLIPAGTTIPAHGSEEFFTVSEGQTGVNMRINEGDESNLDYCRELGQGEAIFNSPVPAGYPVRIDISYNEEQIIEASAYDGKTGAHLGEVRIKREGSLSDIEKQTARDAVKSSRVS